MVLGVGVGVAAPFPAEVLVPLVELDPAGEFVDGAEVAEGFERYLYVTGVSNGAWPSKIWIDTVPSSWGGMLIVTDELV